MKKFFSWILTLALSITVLFGCAEKQAFEFRFTEDVPKNIVLQDECDLSPYLYYTEGTEIVSVTYTYTYKGKDREYIGYGDNGLTFTPNYLADVTVTVTGKYDGKEKTLTHVLAIDNAKPKVTSRPTKTFYIGQEVTFDELLDGVKISPSDYTLVMNSVEYDDETVATFTEEDTAYTFMEAGDYRFRFTLSNDGGSTKEWYNVSVTPYQSEAEKTDLTNLIDLYDFSDDITTEYYEECAPGSGGSYSYKLTANPDLYWTENNGGTVWYSYVFIDFETPIDASKQYVTFDAKRSADTYGAIVCHYTIGRTQMGPMSLSCDPDTWVTFSTENFNKSGEYTGLCIIVLHSMQEHDKNNVWNLIDNLQIHNRVVLTEEEKLDCIQLVKSDKLNKVTVLNDKEFTSNDNGNYSLKVTVDSTATTADMPYVFLDFSDLVDENHEIFRYDDEGNAYLDGTQYYVTADIYINENVRTSIDFGYLKGWSYENEFTPIEAGQWVTLSTENMEPGTRHTGEMSESEKEEYLASYKQLYTGISFIFRTKEDSDMSNVVAWIDNVRIIKRGN